jgi:UDP-perosamine 4-acetyltransferase
MSKNSEPEIIVVGAGGHGKSVVSILLASGRQVYGVLDDNPDCWGTFILGVPVLGPIKTLGDYPKKEMAMGVGDNTNRKELVRQHSNVSWINVQSSTTYINPTAKIGQGTIIFPFAVIGADVSIGDHVIISSHVTLGHDTVLENYVQVAPGVQVAGSVYVEREAMLGIGSTVCPKVRIGKKAILGAGAVAVNDILSGCLALGIPAKVNNGP